MLVHLDVESRQPVERGEFDRPLYRQGLLSHQDLLECFGGLFPISI